MPLPSIPPGAPGAQWTFDANGNQNGLRSAKGVPIAFRPIASWVCGAFGDSITDQINYGSLYNSNSIGYMTWVTQLTVGRVKFYLAVNGGVSGQTTVDMLTRIDAFIVTLLANSARACVVHMGTNDLAGGIAYATTMLNAAKIYGKLLAAGIIPIIMPITPRSYSSTATLQKQLRRLNSGFRNLAQTTPGCLWADPSLAKIDQTDQNTWPLDGSLTPSAVVTASFATNQMTVTAVTNGFVDVGMQVRPYPSGVPGTQLQACFVTSQISGTTGGAGVYGLGSSPGTIASGQVNLSYTGDTYDGVHNACVGAWKDATAIVNTMTAASLLNFPALGFVSQWDLFDAVNNPTGSVFQNPMMAGSSALPGTNGVTGFIATGYTLTRVLGSTATAVASKVTVATDNGNTQPALQIVFTTPAGEKAGWNLVGTYVGGSATVIGQTVSAWVNLKTTAPTPGSLAVLFMKLQDGVHTCVGNVNPTATKNYQPNAALDIQIPVQPLLIAATNSLAQTLAITLDGNAVASGNATVTIIITQMGAVITG